MRFFLIIVLVVLLSMQTNAVIYEMCEVTKTNSPEIVVCFERKVKIFDEKIEKIKFVDYPTLEDSESTRALKLEIREIEIGKRTDHNLIDSGSYKPGMPYDSFSLPRYHGNYELVINDRITAEIAKPLVLKLSAPVGRLILLF